ncbi:MAG: pilus assembly protein [Chloroflexi bacterium]|nr:pilus assembly protein [Chloroflexota bacterium]
MNKSKLERGQSLVEFAISLVIILWLLAGAVEFGIALFQYIQLRDAAQEGALYGSINPPASAAANDPNRLAIIARVRNASSSPLNLNDTSAVTVTVTVTGNGCVNGTSAVTVTASYNHQVFMPFATLFMGNTIPLSASVTDTILNSSC